MNVVSTCHCRSCRRLLCPELLWLGPCTRPIRIHKRATRIFVRAAGTSAEPNPGTAPGKPRDEAFRHHMRQASIEQRHSATRSNPLVGSSPAMADLKAEIERVARSDAK